jgi:hypothetical protein
MKSQPIAITFCILVVLVAATALPAATYPATALEKKVQALTDKLAPGLIDIRRDIHCHPELGLQETRTSAIVADEASIAIGVNLMANIILDHQAKRARATPKK